LFHTSKNGLTLVELVLAIFLFGILTTFLYSIAGELRFSNSLLQERDKRFNERNQFIEILRKDLFGAEEFSIEKRNSENMVLHMRTTNSLYNSYLAYVKWFLHPETHTLVRAESSSVFVLPVLADKLHLVRFDPIWKNLENFRAYLSKQNDGIIVSTKDINTSQIFAIELPKFSTISASGSSSKSKDDNTTSKDSNESDKKDRS
jgi:prepilin-type N-terminal cleavage/methylation domain-containing protein